MIQSFCKVETNAQGQELQKHGTALLPLACYRDNLTDLAVPWHWHDEFELTTVISGKVLVAAGSEQRVLHMGQGLFVNSGVLHGMWPEGEETCRMFSIVFHPRLVGGSADSVFWQRYVQPLMDDAGMSMFVFDPEKTWQADAIAQFRRAWNAFEGEAPGYEFILREALSQLLFMLCRHSERPHAMPGAAQLRSEARMKAMIGYIQQHYAEPITAKQIAASASVSESECLRCFRDTINATPMQYLRQFRIRQATELLLETDLPIAEIGALCGFLEMSYFAKTFKDACGCTPSAYRKTKR